MNSDEAYSIATSVRLHFDSSKSYDAVKFGFKGPRKRLKENERFIYLRFAKKYKRDEFIDFCVANALSENCFWIGDYTEENYLLWLGRIQTFSYVFKRDLTFMKGQGYNFDSLLIPEDSETKIITFLRQGEICPETIIAIDMVTNFLSHINKLQISDPLGIFKDIVYRLTAYKRIVMNRIDKQKAKEIIINVFT